MSSLLEELGIDPEEFEWTQLGICTNSDFDQNDFYDEYENSVEHAKLIDQMCLACPVMKQCANSAMINKETGVWGAIYWDGTGKPSDSKNEHKDPETWKRIARKLK
jgi:hypothetical protein